MTTAINPQEEINREAIRYTALLRERLQKEHEKRESKDRRVAALILKHDLKSACEVLAEASN